MNNLLKEARSLLGSATPNPKLLDEQGQVEWAKRLGKWWAESCNTASPLRFMGKNSLPKRSGWYYVREVVNRKCIGLRYFDDSNSTWYAISKDCKNDGLLVPNDSFHDWLNIPGVTNHQ